MKRLLLSVLALGLLVQPAQARHHHVRAVVHVNTEADPGCNIIFPCEGVVRNRRGDIFGDKMKFGSGIPRYYHRRSEARPVVPRLRRLTRSEPVARVRRAVAPVVAAVVNGARAVGETIARPGDCYGIPWCGCFMRHYKGLADSGLNVARAWAHVGSPTSPHAGAIVVWSHHVGELRSEIDARGRAYVFSGNNGSGNRATVRYQYVRNAIAFREM